MDSDSATSIVWFRHDLRIQDHPALEAAHSLGGNVIPVYIFAPEEEGDWAPGGASQWWLHQSLQSLERDLRARGSRLILRRGNSLEILQELVRETRATHVFWTRRYEPSSVERDQRIKGALRAAQIQAESFNGALLLEPWKVKTKAGGPFQVFTPYWKTCLVQLAQEPWSAWTPPKTWRSPAAWPKSIALEALELEPRIGWATAMAKYWRPGEKGAAERLAEFLDHAFSQYSDRRNLPGIEGTSRLSPYLHFGEISPRRIWEACGERASSLGQKGDAWRTSQFIAEIGWREFGYHLLFHFPQTTTSPLRQSFTAFDWRHDAKQLKAWQKGRTGYPLVDAGMRELWAHGWMHNRVRMVVASFLVKHLRMNWTEGARWFWDTLVDADLASNTLGWQWTAGCGADAAPYFRVFNPVTQGEKFDPDGEYVRRWVPELSRLPTSYLHAPWTAPVDVLRASGVTLGKDYPHPIVDHAKAREAALAAYSALSR